MNMADIENDELIKSPIYHIHINFPPSIKTLEDYKIK